MQHSYRSESEENRTVFEGIKTRVQGLYRVLHTNPKARDLGCLELEDAPITPNIAELFDNYKKASSEKTKLANLEPVTIHLARYLSQVHPFISEVGDLVDKALKRIDTHTSKPIVALRDFFINPELTEILVYIALRSSTGKVSMESLKRAFPQYRDNIEEIINNISDLWQEILTIDPETNEIELLDEDFKNFRTIFSCRSFSKETKITKLRDTADIRWGKILYMMKLLHPSEFYEKFGNEWTEYLNRNLQDFNGLFSEKNIAELNVIQIYTGKEFLERDIYELKLKTNMTRLEIIECKLHVASRLCYNPKDFDISIIHPSIATKTQLAILPSAIKHLKSFFKNERVTYDTILTYNNESTKDNSIILTTDDSKYRRLCYKIIAFIRQIHKQITIGEPGSFEPLSSNWSYESELTPSEVRNLKIMLTDVKNPLQQKDQCQENSTHTGPENDEKNISGIKQN